MAKQRVQKILAQAGIASRRKSEQLIIDGRVKINGQVARQLGVKADPNEDEIYVVGHGTISAEPHVYIALHKTTKVVSTVSDPERRRTVIDLVEDTRAWGRRSYEGGLPRLYPVGRLDFDAEGLILLTNDGDLANLLTHPRNGVPKTYAVKVRGHPDAKSLERLRRGVRLKEPNGSLSRPTRPAEVEVIPSQARTSTWLRLTIFEGRYHQVKRMMEVGGHSVGRLIREDLGGVELGDLPYGAWRFLGDDEVAQLRGWRVRDGDAATKRRRRK